MPKYFIPLFVPILLLLLSGKILAVDFPIEVTEYIDDVKIHAYINKKDVNPNTRWIPFKNPPPLSITDALEKVHSYIKENDDLNNTRLIGIELKQIPHHEDNWHYLVKIKTMIDDTPVPHFFVVLMDGKVISAIKMPDSIK